MRKGSTSDKRRAMKESPALAHGKICYIEIPAREVAESAAFYESAFGWRIRRRSDGAVAFDDSVNEVSGTWVLGRSPSAEPGLLVYIMVEDAAASVEKIRKAGGEIVREIDPGAKEIVARFRDPAGNVLGIYQESALGE